MKLIIHSSDRKEYVNLPEREPDDLPREIRSQAAAPERTLLGQSLPAEQLPIESDEEVGPRDLLGELLEDNETEESDGVELEHEASWKHSRWPGVLFVTALASTRSDLVSSVAFG